MTGQPLTDKQIEELLANYVASARNSLERMVCEAYLPTLRWILRQKPLKAPAPDENGSVVIRTHRAD